jgi:Fic/DOC family
MIMDTVDEVFFTGSNPSADRQIRRRAAAGEFRKIYQGIYTRNLTEPLELIDLRHGLKIAAHLFPGAVLSGRTAREMQPTRATDNGAKTGPGFVFLCHPNARRNLTLPGLEIRVIQGTGPQPGDFPLLNLYAPSIARALLDNLTPSRSTAGVSRTLGQKGVEEWLDRLCDQEGEPHLNRLRDQARALAPALGLETEFTLLDRIIGALLGTREAQLKSAAARARGKGLAYDEAAMNRYTLLAAALRSSALPETYREPESPEGRVAASFIEAYFSNYIEGTRFLVEEAKHIVFDGRVPAQRPQDGHDVLATYRQLINLGARAPSAVDIAAFEEEIKARHADLMASRPENDPGRYKQQPNAAGNTVFVFPSRVRGTLLAGLQILGGLEHPFARAVFVHFLIADVHPFVDGNGRISRIMMTKELLAAGLSRITVPTVWREDYLGALRALNRYNDPAPIVRAFAFAQRVTAACAAVTTDDAILSWASTYAFVEAGAHARLTLPRADARVEWKKGIPAPAEYWNLTSATSDIPSIFTRS